MLFLKTTVFNKYACINKIIKFRTSSHLSVKNRSLNMLSWMCILVSGSRIYKRSVFSSSDNRMPKSSFNVVFDNCRILAYIMPIKNILIRIYLDISSPICHGL